MIFGGQSPEPQGRTEVHTDNQHLSNSCPLPSSLFSFPLSPAISDLISTFDVSHVIISSSPFLSWLLCSTAVLILFLLICFLIYSAYFFPSFLHSLQPLGLQLLSLNPDLFLPPPFISSPPPHRHLTPHLSFLLLSLTSFSPPSVQYVNPPPGLSREEIDEASLCILSPPPPRCLSSFQYGSSFT